jgi:hypothetical protein
MGDLASFLQAANVNGLDDAAVLREEGVNKLRANIHRVQVDTNFQAIVQRLCANVPTTTVLARGPNNTVYTTGTLLQCEWTQEVYDKIHNTNVNLGVIIVFGTLVGVEEVEEP